MQSPEQLRDDKYRSILQFETKKLKNLIKIQERMMLLMSCLEFDKENEEEESEEYEDEDGNGESPIHSELFTLMELYKVIISKVGPEY